MCSIGLSSAREHIYLFVPRFIYIYFDYSLIFKARREGFVSSYGSTPDSYSSGVQEARMFDMDSFEAPSTVEFTTHLLAV